MLHTEIEDSLERVQDRLDELARKEEDLLGLMAVLPECIVNLPGRLITGTWLVIQMSWKDLPDEAKQWLIEMGGFVNDDTPHSCITADLGLRTGLLIDINPSRGRRVTYTRKPEERTVTLYGELIPQEWDVTRIEEIKPDD